MDICHIFLDLLVCRKAQVVRSAFNLTPCPQKKSALTQGTDRYVSGFLIKIPFLYLKLSLS